MGENAAYTPECRDAFGPLSEAHFLLRACTMCYVYLFPTSPLGPLPPHFEALVDEHQRVFPADPRNHTAVCHTLNKDQCKRWRECCYAAENCCQSQLRHAHAPPTDHCPRRWDGWSCWEDTKAGQTVYGECPMYLEHSVSTEHSVKTCTENATWYRSDITGGEWTNYTTCLDRQSHLAGVYLTLGCNLASLALLVPAIIILLAFRELRKQHRVRLHIQFFSALSACALVSILWFMLVHHDVLVNDVSSETVLYTNPVWCRVLSFGKIYLTSCTYMWMFCEGYYLHRLITKAFEPPKSLMLLYVLGWGLPVLPNLVYAGIRVLFDNKKCWAVSLGQFQWIIDGPNLICLLVNCGFLCNIVRILVFQMHSHAHEPSNFRRGLKAAFMLIPLFGLQLIVTVYRPGPDMPGREYYEYLHLFIISSQGFFVALIFCFINGEVLSHLGKMCPFCHRRNRKKRKRRLSLQMTQMTSAEDCRTPSLSARTLTPSGSTGSSPKKSKPLLLRPTNGELEALVPEDNGIQKHNSHLGTPNGNTVTGGGYLANGNKNGKYVQIATHDT